MSKVTDSIRDTRASIATVLGNPDLRRLNLAFAGSAIGDWAYATAILIWAYGVGGSAAVGIWFTIRLVLMTVITPFASTLVDRLPRRALMVWLDLIRALTCAVAAILLAVGAPAITVFVVATLTSLVSTPFRPAIAAILPSLVRSPEELVAANGTTSTIDSLSFLVGPALGGLMVAWFDIPVVVAFNVVTFLWSAALLARIGERPDTTDEAADEAVREPTDGQPANPGAEVEEPQGFLAESMAGFRIIAGHPGLRMVCGVYAAQTVVAGAAAVFEIEMAEQMTSFGSHGVGFLDSVMGIGAVVGGLVAISRSTAGRLASDFGVGVVFWALPLLLAAIWPQAWAAFLAMLIIGVANPVVDVNAATILQRLAPEAALGRVFGALEAALIGSMAVGAAVMPLLLNWIGLRGGLAVLAVLITVAVIPAFTRLRRMDAELAEPSALDLLRDVALFGPLEPKALELLARTMTRVEVPAAATVISEGDPGDRFFVVESGALTATFRGAVLSRMGPGDPFGEIALLRDVPRTATVTADQPSVLYALDRDRFLAAVSGSVEVATRADDLIAKRIPTY